MALDYTIAFNGITIGNGTSLPIMGATGLEDMPPIRSGDLTRGGTHGETPGLDLSAGRDVAVDVVVLDSGVGDYFTNIERLKLMTSVLATEVPLTFQLPGRNPRTLNARCRARSLPVAGDYQYRYGRASLLWHATDPRIYDAAWSATTIGLPSASTGLTFPAAAPFVFGSAGTGGTLVAVNAGNFPAPWLAQIAGPVTNPSISHDGLGLAVTWNGTVLAGETLVIDSLAKSVLLNGTASRYSLTVAQWFDLDANGSTTVRFNAASGTGTLTFNYRSTWL